MSIFGWCTRRVGGLSIVVLIGLCYWVISDELSKLSAISGHSLHDVSHHEGLGSWEKPAAGGWSHGLATKIFAYYSLLIHTLVFAFPLRACWAVFDLTESLKESIQTRSQKEVRFELPRRISSSSLESSETLTPSVHSTPMSEEEDTDISSYSDSDGEQDHIIHAIIIPNYKEELDGLRETLDVLACHPQARYQYDIYLAMEMREANADSKAMTLVNEFVKKFRFIDFTLHPSDIPGEAPGKGSNTAWAARKASERYSMSQRKDVIITGIDADSHLSAQYTAHITSMHCAHTELAATTMYCAPIIFDRNAHQVPIVVRVADVLWCAAGLSGLYRGSSIRPPTSVYSMPLKLVDRVGGWDCDNEAIGEDLHMYLKCFFATNGNLVTRTVLAPVSQSNVSGTGTGWRGGVDGCRARYKQAMRHMWGALDSGYAMRQMVQLWQDRKSMGRSFRPLHASSTDKTNLTYIPEPETYNNLSEGDGGIFSDITHSELSSPDYLRIAFLFHRLFEAHFLPIHMAILVISSGIYDFIIKSNSATAATDAVTTSLAWTFTLTNVLRIAGFLCVALYMFFYESYHSICVSSREADMRAAGLYQAMKDDDGFSHRSWRRNCADYIMIPLVAPMFGSIPAVQAQISHFWTRDLVYAVSAKPMVATRAALGKTVEALA